MMRFVLATIWFVIWSATGWAQSSSSPDYVLTLDGVEHELSLDQDSTIKLKSGAEIPVKLSRREFSRFKTGELSFEYSGKYSVASTQVDDNTTQHIVVTALGNWHKSDNSMILTTEGEALQQLYYVFDGEIEVRKGNRTLPVEAGVFIGEIAYLKNVPVSATVIAKPGAHYISWSHDDLKTIVTRHASLKQSFSNLLSGDMAMKVAKS
jgi:CRP-like cAMP-binding protein